MLWWCKTESFTLKQTKFVGLIMTKKKGKKTIKKSGLDKLWSKKVKELAGFKCEICGATDRLNSHHIISRQNLATRWDLKNGACLCVNHHIGKLSAHKNSLIFIRGLIAGRGTDWADKLAFRSLEDFSDWKDHIDEIRKELQ